MEGRGLSLDQLPDERKVFRPVHGAIQVIAAPLIPGGAKDFIHFQGIRRHDGSRRIVKMQARAKELLDILQNGPVGERPSGHDGRGLRQGGDLLMDDGDVGMG